MEWQQITSVIGFVTLALSVNVTKLFSSSTLRQAKLACFVSLFGLRPVLVQAIAFT
jgi:hypothetical protein